MAGITVLENLCERFYRTGQRCLADRDYRGAITEFTKVLNGLPHHRGAHYLLAESLLRFGPWRRRSRRSRRCDGSSPPTRGWPWRWGDCL